MSSLRRILSRWLYPATHRDAERYWRLWNGLDEARWWPGVQHPEAASLAHRLIDEDHEYWTSAKPTRDPA
ncbi:hypothetical protein [Methylobacterium gnaphalii]|uniref:Uncharacterized protein n=1 Tax=Methylobacterium gnaphalii TaxID=1010610 RepID=A0A512JM94_9HYPH|nr:hypothetical protein [Methylobacterium gnaphalii]GEP11087.1 hypothetical protein MGN01_29320 [Methylobacterium gnaphalii]GJD67099.1 hypothetical protein MMMDOFMJ_0012 [Methylobacterium gnaphalii]GLS50365.1 hypothetical protein GCM10007885_32170 [Methylobacterium gnaphalii]